MISHGLLLLPSPPTPASEATIAAAFGLPLHAAVEALRSHSEKCILDVALPLLTHEGSIGCVHSDEIIHLTTAVYALLRGMFAECEIPTAGPGSIDIRIIPLLYDARSTYTPLFGVKRHGPNVTPTIPCLVYSQRLWDSLYVVESEEGEEVYRKFRAVAVAKMGSTPTQVLSGSPCRVPGGIVLRDRRIVPRRSIAEPTQYRLIYVRGSFATLDFADKLLLTVAAHLLRPVSATQQHLPGGEIILISSESAQATETEDSNKPIENATSFLRAVGDFQPISEACKPFQHHSSAIVYLPGEVTVSGMSSQDLQQIIQNGSLEGSALIEMETGGEDYLQGIFRSPAGACDYIKLTNLGRDEKTI